MFFAFVLHFSHKESIGFLQVFCISFTYLLLQPQYRFFLKCIYSFCNELAVCFLGLTLAGVRLGGNGEARGTGTGETTHDVVTGMRAGGLESTFILI